MTRTPRSSLFAGLGIALALATSAAAQDYSKYRVLDTRVIENMWAGPGQSAALLSPDGSRLLHLGHRDPDMCLFAPAQIGSWVELGCADYTKENRPGEAQDMLWSPDNDQLLMPTYNDAAARFRDTDIRTFDPVTFTVRNLTDDGFAGSLTRQVQSELDMLGQWGDSGTIYFVRSSLPEGGPKAGVTTSLMKIAADGGEPEKILDIITVNSPPVWTFAVAPGQGLLAYSVEGQLAADKAGLYLLKSGSTEPTRVAEMADIDIDLTGLAFSADGKYLLLLGRIKDGYNAARILDLATGKIVPVDASQNVTGVAWSPTGSALAYVTNDKTKPDMPGGLFLAPAPGKPARLLIGGGFYPPVCCGDRPFVWATNDTMVLSQLNDNLGTVLYIQLGE